MQRKRSTLGDISRRDASSRGDGKDGESWVKDAGRAEGSGGAIKALLGWGWGWGWGGDVTRGRGDGPYSLHPQGHPHLQGNANTIRIALLHGDATVYWSDHNEEGFLCSLSAHLPAGSIKDDLGLGCPIGFIPDVHIKILKKDFH